MLLQSNFTVFFTLAAILVCVYGVPLGNNQRQEKASDLNNVEEKVTLKEDYSECQLVPRGLEPDFLVNEYLLHEIEAEKNKRHLERNAAGATRRTNSYLPKKEDQLVLGFLFAGKESEKDVMGLTFGDINPNFT